MCEPGPDAAELQQILAAAIRVPDHKKLAPWRIQVVTGPAQEHLGRACARAYRQDHPEATQEVVAIEEARPQRSPLLLVVATRLVSGASVPEIEQLLSGGAVCMNILNAAHALGFVGQWLTDWPAYDARIKTALGHAPSDHVLGWIHVGSTSRPPAERPRVGIADVVSWWKPGA